MSDKNKGFASMDKEKVREIAAKGGHASHKDNDHNNNNNNTNSKNDQNSNRSKGNHN